MRSLILIDDDQLIHNMWTLMSKSKGHKLTAFTSVSEFVSRSQELDKNIDIYIDAQLENENGIEEAEKVFNLGFENLILASGAEVESLPHWFKGQQGKEYPIF